MPERERWEMPSRKERVDRYGQGAEFAGYVLADCAVPTIRALEEELAVLRTRVEELEEIARATVAHCEFQGEFINDEPDEGCDPDCPSCRMVKLARAYDAATRSTGGEDDG